MSIKIQGISVNDDNIKKISAARNKITRIGVFIKFQGELAFIQDIWMSGKWDPFNLYEKIKKKIGELKISKTPSVETEFIEVKEIKELNG